MKVIVVWDGDCNAIAAVAAVNDDQEEEIRARLSPLVRELGCYVLRSATTTPADAVEEYLRGEIEERQADMEAEVRSPACNCWRSPDAVCDVCKPKGVRA